MCDSSICILDWLYWYENFDIEKNKTENAYEVLKQYFYESHLWDEWMMVEICWTAKEWDPLLPFVWNKAIEEEEASSSLFFSVFLLVRWGPHMRIWRQMLPLASLEACGV